MARRRFRLALWLIPLLAVLILVVTHRAWLGSLGSYLVRAEAPIKADAIVVLAGDRFGNRVLKACELLREGYAPRALIDGPCCYYGVHESELAIAFAAKAGCPAHRLDSFPMQAMNTRDEAAAVAAELRKRQIRSFLVITSDYHTRRAAKAFARVARPESFRMVAAPDKYFRAGEWWHDRESRKIVFMEWSKTIATWVGM